MASASKNPEPTVNVRLSPEELADRIDAAGSELAGRIDEASAQIATRIDVIADELGEARVRFGRSFRRLGDAVADLGDGAKRPTSKMGRVLEDIAYDARRSWDRITGKRPKSRWAFWK
jgi:hypothetical protein